MNMQCVSWLQGIRGTWHMNAEGGLLIRKEDTGPKCRTGLLGF